jgi:trimethylamine:corrinoid methyltransferase-like protein
MWQLLSRDQLETLHSSALGILEKVGVRVVDRSTLQIFHDQGATVDDKNQTVKIPPSLVEEAVKKAPREVTLGARNKKYAAKLEPGRMYTRASTGLTEVIDLETGLSRHGLSKDTADASRLIQDLDNVSINATHIFPSDTPPHVRDVHSFKLALDNCEKHVVTTPLSRTTLDFQKRLATVFEEESDSRSPIFSSLVCPISPLTLRDPVTIFCAEKNIPAIIVSGVVVGVASPVTLAGTLVQQSAECLATITLMQIVNPGTPVIIGNKSSPLDQRYATPLSGVVEIGLLSAACVQVAQFYGLPGEGFGLRSDSKTIDEQAGVERVFVGLLPALAGARLDSGAGSAEAINTFSLEQLVIDNEVYGMIQRVLRGIDFDEERLALNEIAGVGPGGNYLGRPHTRKFYLKEFYQHRLFDKKTRSAWEASGHKDIREQAKHTVRNILAEHRPVTQLGRDAQQKISVLLKEAESNTA